MLTKVQKWGTSQGLRLPKAILDDARLKVGDEVDVSVQGKQIVIGPTKRIRGRYRLSELLARMPKGHRVEEVDWGPPVGKEEW
ncbi:MAG: transcriptional regulator/antitoxin, MazE [Armatimonadetes bacterium CG2_30_66_41]|nr:AbrB/MazE/SpoVT family DNA-binding domain-containing protein [Armatimonadota bacterium]OIO94596.1 MAG: transcriptional regulator/antitoxin, MazE [Armatimonadetes bacterium CG2_30_66_41]PIU92745.1 MAG: transcriptional regulator/antitoxin, MazE [Armatimonadetes bacterium CG06_land_8_20_14_3_00_66_21]PIX39873.1 MAG: transcriptional regulator/antitoxin, MazE [Armatimonadetes bacterium CG_4_8_14_3_um_filter_66_20]NCO90572.1 AbrB/MazE/SpoVT family DNA-binding domain-containing protein [Armatimonad